MTKTDYILSIDPGLSSAVALLSVPANEVPKLEYVDQFSGGAEALTDWVSRNQVEPYIGFWVQGIAWVEPEDVICEAFTARNTKGFSYTTASLEALPCIGALVARGLVDRKDKKRYRDPKFQYLVGGTDLDDKRKRQHKFLKESGYYIDREAIGRTLPDYNDARSAVSHGLAYIARELKHKPTWELIQSWTEKN